MNIGVRPYVQDSKRFRCKDRLLDWEKVKVEGYERIALKYAYYHM